MTVNMTIGSSSTSKSGKREIPACGFARAGKGSIWEVACVRELLYTDKLRTSQLQLTKSEETIKTSHREARKLDDDSGRIKVSQRGWIPDCRGLAVSQA